MMRHLAFGTLFGFVLSRAGATEYDAIAGMFRLEDLHLMGVIGVAVVAAGLLLFAGRRFGWRTAGGLPFVIEPKSMKPGLVVGGLLFGVGWALAGTCPGTALAQVGEGRGFALFTVAGMLAGTALYRLVGARVETALRAGRSRVASSTPDAP